MDIFKYIYKSLIFYKKKHFTLFLAAILSTAIISGALIVGDSVRYSLENILNQRLANVSFALSSNEHLISTELVSKLNEKSQENVSGIIQTKGLLINSENELSVPNIDVFAVDNNFWKFSDKDIKSIKDNEVYISENLSARLNVKAGDNLLLRLEIPQEININSPFSQNDNNRIALRVVVKDVLGDDNLGRFSLKSDQKKPFNLFVSHGFLSKKINLETYVNQVFVSGENENIENLNKLIQQNWNLKDMSLRIDSLSEDKSVLNSSKIFIPQNLETTIDNFGSSTSSSFSYLINEISNGDKSTPYSFVSAFKSNDIKDNEIIINSWLAEDLSLEIGDSVELKYFIFNTYRELEEETEKFRVKTIADVEDPTFSKELMPNFPGLVDAGSCNEWEAGVPIDFDKIRDKDESYWEKYKASPKAVISLNKAKDLWSNQYGESTGFVITGGENTRLELVNYLSHNVKAESLGLVFHSPIETGEKAASSGVDFGELFLSLSFFVIVTSLILLSLIYSINLRARKKEFASLKIIGIKVSVIAKIILLESLVFIIFGSIIGALLGIYYNDMLIYGLNTIWQDAVYTKSLLVNIKPVTIVISALVGMTISFITVFFNIRSFNKESLKDNLSISRKASRSGSLIKIVSLLGLLLFLIFLMYTFFYDDFSPQNSLILASLFLLISLLKLKVFFEKIFNKINSGLSKYKLVLKNISNPQRKSQMLIVLLSLGVFSVMITGANRKTFALTENDNKSGTGGFKYWIETSMPILFNLNTYNGRDNLGLNEVRGIDSLSFIQAMKLEGDDASCLNLNQVQSPSILGIDTRKLDQRSSFDFANLLDTVDKDNPWKFLDKELSENVIPVYLDQTVITWGIMKAVGDTLTIMSENGEELSLVIAGGLNASIFQGHILMSDEIFKLKFPSNSGAKLLLVDGNNDEFELSIEELYGELRDFGIDKQKTNQRLAQFNAVTNTYLDVFTILGALALIIGTFGLGLLIKRSIMERDEEFKLLKVIGWRNKEIRILVLSEFSIILVLGILIGLFASFFAMIPSILSDAFSMPWTYIIISILAILISGLLWIFLFSRRIKI